MKFLIFLLAAVSLVAEQPDGLYAIITTSQGAIRARLHEKDTPQTVENFVALAQGTKATLDPKTRKMVKRPLYNNITFHRVVPGEMIQAGDPTGIGSHNCGVKLQDEFLPGLRFATSGRLAMANTGDPNSGGCQFFITVNPMPSWNGKYAIFGMVVDGMDVVNRINHGRVREDRPVDPVKLLSVTIERIGPEPVKKHRKR